MINRFHAGLANRPLRELAPIEFEVVDFDSAKAAWVNPAQSAAKPKVANEPAGSTVPSAIDGHGALSPGQDYPTAHTLLWFAKLPEGMRPQAMLNDLPQLANRIAHHWAERVPCTSLLEDLLLARRGDLPPAVAAELERLRDLRRLLP